MSFRPDMAKGPSLSLGGGSFPPTSPAIAPAWFLLGTKNFGDFVSPGGGSIGLYATLPNTFFHAFFIRVITPFYGSEITVSNLTLASDLKGALTAQIDTSVAADYPSSYFDGGAGNYFNIINWQYNFDAALTQGQVSAYALISKYV